MTRDHTDRTDHANDGHSIDHTDDGDEGAAAPDGPQLTEPEVRDLLTRTLAALRDVPVDDPDLRQTVEEALTARRRHFGLEAQEG